MKIKFRDNKTSQAPVSNIQTETKNTPLKHKPVFKVFITFLTLALIILCIYHFYRSKYVYTFGVVAGEKNYFKAPSEGIVTEIYSLKGALVKSGTPLMTFVPDDPGNIIEAEEKLKIQERSLAQLEMLEKDVSLKFPAHSTPSSNMEPGFKISKEDLERIEKQSLLTLENKKIQVTKSQEWYALKKDRYQRTKLLFELDAATRDDLLKAEEEMAESSLKVEQTLNELALSRIQEKENSNMERSLMKLIESENVLDLELKRLRSEVKISRSKLSTLKNKYASQIIRAPFDGIIIEKMASPGQKMSQNETMLIFASMEKQWVDAYMPTTKTNAVKPGLKTEIYVKGVDKRIHSKITKTGSIEEKIPDRLVEFFPGTPYGQYFRIEIPSNSGLIPGMQVRIVLM